MAERAPALGWRLEAGGWGQRKSHAPLASQRLFFALWPSEALQRQIESSMRARVEAVHGRAILARNLHVTLAFLGSVPEHRVGTVIECGAKTYGSAFALTLDQIEIWRRSQVLSLTPAATPSALRELEERLRFNLLSEQFEIRQEEYRPHLTLARDVRARNARERIEPIELHVDEFVLVQSRPGRGGSEYSVVERWALSREAVSG